MNITNLSAPTPSGDMPAELAGLVAALNGTDVEWDGQFVFFVFGEVDVYANLDRLTDRVRVRFYLLSDDREVVEQWVARQPAPRAALLEAEELFGRWSPRLVLERLALGHDWASDPALRNLDRLETAWLNHSDTTSGTTNTASTTDPQLRLGHPADIDPVSAWLLMGDDASFPDEQDLHQARRNAAAGIHDYKWTVSAQALPGDLVLLYFIAPHKAAHFLARVASRPVFRRDLEVGAAKPVHNSQWWADLTTPIQIEPIAFTDLQKAAGGPLLLRGRSGRYLRPQTISALTFRALDPAQQDELDRIAATPVGLADLPDPDTMNLEQWRELSAGPLHLEELVSRHLVEPLLRHTAGSAGVRWEREWRIGQRVADYVLFDGPTATHVVEVKKVIRRKTDEPWEKSRDYAQLRWYADQLGVPGTLMDSHHIVLVEPGAPAPSAVIDRRTSTAADIETIRTHLTRR